MADIFNYQITPFGKAHFLKQFLTEHTFYFAFGKSSSWDLSWGVDIDDTNPPKSNYKLGIPEPFVYKQALAANLVVPANCDSVESKSTFTFEGESWSFLDHTKLTIDQLSTLSPQHFFMSVDLDVEDFIQPSFRAVGLYVDLQLKSGVSNQVIYTPDQVENPGILYWLSYNTPIVKRLDKKVKVDILLKP
jgi:hypothetical protein